MQRWVAVSINTQWYASDIAVNILTGTQLKAKECYSGQHVFKSWVAAELSTCHEHISYWIMSWSHYQLLVHHYHISHLQNFEHVMNTSVTIVILVICLQNFEHVMNTSVIGSPSSCQSFTEFWTCHVSCVQNLFLFWLFLVADSPNIKWNVLIRSI